LKDIRFVLFDAVGTLIRVRPSVVEIYLAVGSRFGSRLTREQIRQRFAQSLTQFYDGGPTDEARERERWRAIVSDVLHDVSDARDRLFEQLWEAFGRAEQWSLYHDVAAVWTELQRRGRVVGIASNFDLRLQRICRSLPPLDTATHCFVSSQIGFLKPHPEFYRRVERELQATSAEILLVGDCRSHDVDGARAAGWQAVHVDRRGDRAEPGSILSLTSLLDML
jgi:putative hydrolase of the HAD superfamily